MFLEDLVVQDGTQNGPSSFENRCKKMIFDNLPFYIQFGSQNGAKMEAKRGPKSNKIGYKNQLKQITEKKSRGRLTLRNSRGRGPAASTKQKKN